MRIADASLSSKLASKAAEHRMPGNRNVLYLVIGVLIVAVGVLGYNLYKAKQEPEGLQINVGPDGLKIKAK
jgi:RsiW-degrading membrane proteinase PrsW (M82 family)